MRFRKIKAVKHHAGNFEGMLDGILGMDTQMFGQELKFGKTLAKVAAAKDKEYES